MGALKDALSAAEVVGGWKGAKGGNWELEVGVQGRRGRRWSARVLSSCSRRERLLLTEEKTKLVWGRSIMQAIFSWGKQSKFTSKDSIC